MKLKELIDKCGLERVTKFFDSDREISGCYASDLLSDVMANAKKDNLWITLQVHINITAVAVLKELTAIIVVMDRLLDEDTIKKAEEEKITILRTKLSTYSISGLIHDCGIE
jgi:hypothetical protein